MKKWLGIVLIAVLVLGSGVYGWKEFMLRNIGKIYPAILAQSSPVYLKSYPYQNISGNAFKFTLFHPQKVQLRCWKRDLVGKTRVILMNELGGRVIRDFTLKGGHHLLKLKLNQGNYIVKFENHSLMGGVVIGLDKGQRISCADLDRDGLPDQDEKEYRTDIKRQDTDGDGLSDYAEVVKYRTDPLKNDSDGDGKRDSLWEERREYAYTIQAIVDLRVPHKLDDMNDLYQDARILKKIGSTTSRVEVILYPETAPIINPSKYRPVSNIYAQPTYTKNFSPQMQQKVRRRISGSQTDLEVVLRILGELAKVRSVDIVTDLKMDNDFPLDFCLLRNENRIHIAPERKSSAYPMNEVTKKVLYADSMYKNQTRGACGSTAILRGGLLRSAGLQERSIFTIPLFYSLKSDHTVIRVKPEYIEGEFLQLDEKNAPRVDHVLNEVVIGNQWVQTDFRIRDHFANVDAPIGIKMICFNDPSEVDFYHQYAKLDFFRERPYKYISVIGQEKKYGNSLNSDTNLAVIKTN